MDNTPKGEQMDLNLSHPLCNILKHMYRHISISTVCTVMYIICVLFNGIGCRLEILYWVPEESSCLVRSLWICKFSCIFLLHAFKSISLNVCSFTIRYILETKPRFKLGESVAGNIRLICEAVSMDSLVMSGYDRLKRCAQLSLCAAGYAHAIVPPSVNVVVPWRVISTPAIIQKMILSKSLWIPPAAAKKFTFLLQFLF